MKSLPKNKGIVSAVSLAVFILAFHSESRARQPDPQDSDANSMIELLEKVRNYSLRLRGGVYDFICLEEISEKIHHERFLPNRSTEHNHYVYDYQLVKKQDEIRESRILLQRNKIRVRLENAELETKIFRHKHVLLRTADLFGEFMSGLNNFRRVGEETLLGEETVILEAVPKTAYEEKYLHGTQPYYLLGRIWVSKQDHSILKIVWNPKVIRDFHFTREFAETIKSDPSITIITEYGVKHKGIRFPSRFSVEEAYIRPSGRSLIRSTMDVVYRDYKFFTVETETIIDR